MESDSTAIIQKTYSLYEVMQSVQSVLQKAYLNRSYWVRCELSRISLHAQSGHCYLELVDKNESSIVAQQRGIIWADKYNSINEKFKAVTNIPLAGGMKVLLQCSVMFHPVHGLSLTIADIEPSFTLGEMARMKNESIAKLKSEGLFNLNRKLSLPLLPRRIALISVLTSRGYQDFMSTIINHQQKYSIQCTLFEATLQGENAVPTLSGALKNIYSKKENFDAIAIIRGGAGDVGLACYDDFSLCALIARSPLPIITGIGHASNETVTEMVAFKNCITPTAAAIFILEKFDEQLLTLTRFTVYLNELSKSFFKEKNNLLLNTSERFSFHVRNHLTHQDFRIKKLTAGIPAYLREYFALKRQNTKHTLQVILSAGKLGKQSQLLIDLNRKIIELKQKTDNYFKQNKTLFAEQNIKLQSVLSQLKSENEIIDHLSEKIVLLDPINTLKRGYSITRLNKKALTDISEIEKGDELETQLANGIVISTVKTKK